MQPNPYGNPQAGAYGHYSTPAPGAQPSFSPYNQPGQAPAFQGGYPGQPQPQQPTFDPQQGMFQASIIAPGAQAYSSAAAFQQPTQYPGFSPAGHSSSYGQAAHPGAYGQPGQFGQPGAYGQHAHPAPPQYGAHAQPMQGAYPTGSSMAAPGFRHAAPYMGAPGPHMTTPGFGAPAFRGAPTISPEQAIDLARRLRTAMRGAGTNDAEVVAILGSNSSQNLALVADQYFRSFGRRLQDALSSDLSGHYKELAVAVTFPHAHYEAELIRAACHGSKDPECVIEILCTRTAQELQAIRQAYANPLVYPGEKVKKGHVGADLAADVRKGMSGKIQRLCHTILMNPRPTSPANPQMATRDADFLIKAAKGLGTDEIAFFEVFATRSYAHLRMVSSEVAKKRGKSLEQLVKSEFSRLQRRALIYILDCAAVGPERAFARILRRSVKGAGTRDDMLVRTVASRYDVDMPKIRGAYTSLFSRDALSDVRGDTSFNYKKLLTSLMGFRAAGTI
eukprot:gnl/Chilomastix_cuspidata/319.p1 GENE.gnl/Chilomastix_cuspidata/319~~gnl/Chilomastix_cuspidata/319.p1  ORF type:complete len:505 (-),score=123.82 gnl/Chilomastix_cuspidata/319:77-1591(-)